MPRFHITLDVDVDTEDFSGHFAALKVLALVDPDDPGITFRSIYCISEEELNAKHDTK